MWEISRNSTNILRSIVIYSKILLLFAAVLLVKGSQWQIDSES